MSEETRIPLLLIGQVPPPWHGQAVANKLLFDHDWEGFEVEILPMNYSSDVSQVGKFSIGKMLHLFRLLFKARRVLSGKPECLVFYPPASANWAPFLRDVLFLTLLGGKRENRVFIFHAAGLARFASAGGIRRFLGRMAYGGAGMALEVSEEKVPPHDIFAIQDWTYCPCGVELPEYESQESAKCSEGCTVLFVGSLREGKGILEIIETARILRDAGRNDFKFRLVGDWASEEFRQVSVQRIISAGLESLVEFPGPAIGDDKWKEYRDADAFFFPTHYASESTPLVVMEALGMGLPVITTNWSGIPRMLEGCQSSVVLPIKSPKKYAAALLELERDRNSTNTADASRRFYEERFSPGEYISRVVKALQFVGRREPTNQLP